METVKKYFFKNLPNQEVKIGDSFASIIKCSNGKMFKSQSIIDKRDIEYLIKRGSIIEKEVKVEQKKFKNGNNYKIKKFGNITILSMDNIHNVDELVDLINKIIYEE